MLSVVPLFCVCTLPSYRYYYAISQPVGDASLRARHFNEVHATTGDRARAAAVHAYSRTAYTRMYSTVQAVRGIYKQY